MESICISIIDYNRLEYEAINVIKMEILAKCDDIYSVCPESGGRVKLSSTTTTSGGLPTHNLLSPSFIAQEHRSYHYRTIVMSLTFFEMQKFD